MVNARNHRYELEKKHQYMKSLLGNESEDDEDTPTKPVDELMQGQTMDEFADDFTKHVKAFSWSHAASGDSFQLDENVQKKVVKKPKVAAPRSKKVSFESLFEPPKKVVKAKKAKKVV